MKKLALAVLMGSLLLGGCAFTRLDKPATDPVAEARPQPTVRLTAIGYGATSSFDGYTPGQRRLMAMRASKLDAYRALAEQIYGVRVVGNSTVSALASQNDGYRVYVNAFVRGSRLISVTPMADGNYETELEIEVNQNFYDYFRAGAETASPNTASPVAIRGSVGPGSAYGTNFYYTE
ncbi:MAG: LPP20 family lipoprotein [Betaproteobacteria bacterium]|nr:LPP20 family lipoprotein [Betaproteobacteria bacterium]